MNLSTTLFFSYAPRLPWADLESPPNGASPTAEPPAAPESDPEQGPSTMTLSGLRGAVLRGGLGLLRGEVSALRANLVSLASETLAMFRISSVLTELARAASVAAIMHVGAWHGAAPQARPVEPAMQERPQVHDSIGGPSKDRIPAISTVCAASPDRAGSTKTTAAGPQPIGHVLPARGRVVMANALNALEGYIRR